MQPPTTAARVYYAHSYKTLSPALWEPLNQHLPSVAEYARKIAEPLATTLPFLPMLAWTAGMLHDLGKYKPECQQMIRGHRERGEKVTWHAHEGAAKAWATGNQIVASTIAGHHSGMHDYEYLAGKIVVHPQVQAAVEQIWPVAMADCPELNNLPATFQLPTGTDRLGQDFITRLTFGCLVGGDWAATAESERVAYGRPEEPKPPALNPKSRLEHVLRFIAKRHEAVSASATHPHEHKVIWVREQTLASCLAAAEQPPGFLMLTSPTGGGKTLSSLAGGLLHAAKYNKRRLIYVSPLLSVIDQNVRIIREALGVGPNDPDVFEHHSAAEISDKTTSDDGRSPKARRAAVHRATRRAESWDAPIIVTTYVQFFESLFSNKPGRCRKFPNLADSVILIDECQSLPPGLFAPTCAMLKKLVEKLGCTVILMTATQPSFDHPALKEHRLLATEIIPPHLDLFTPMKRVNLIWPRGNEKWSWCDVATRMINARTSLCIVNTKGKARALFDELRARGRTDVFHLSTLMCPAHRQAVLAEVQRRLRAKESVCLVSTQLIEAGIDISFPVVFREFAPLASIVQAAGRCNRNGELRDGLGSVYVFRSEVASAPPGWYQAGIAVLENRLRLNKTPRIDVPQDIRDYNQRLYCEGGLDQYEVLKKQLGLQYQAAAEAYELVSEAGQPVLVSTWREHASVIAALVSQAKAGTLLDGLRELAPYQVNVPYHEFDRRLANGSIREIGSGLNLFEWLGEYSSDIGRSN